MDGTKDTDGAKDTDGLHGAGDPADRVPAYRQIRVATPEQPVAALADTEAWLARDAYPRLMSAGAPLFGVVRERAGGGWEVLGSFLDQAPQEARDAMGSEFRRSAQEAREAGDEDAYAACMSAAERMEWEALDELTVVGVRHRIARAECFIRSGPDGPEPPRPSDPDPALPGRSHEGPRPTEGYVLDPIRPTGMSEGVLKVDLLALVRKAGTVPEDVRADSLRAAETHPGGVLLPPLFMTAEYERGLWRPGSVGGDSPQRARDHLAFRLRVMIPWEERLTPEARAPYLTAAERFEAHPADELEVEGRRFRIVRVERLVRFGPDGPEGPRPSDPDPQPPVMVQEQRLRAQGLLPDDEDEDAPIELDEDTQRLADLFHEEEARIRASRER
ncbi:DUF5954 family protein [Streptomyces sp. TRM76323]|uniref:DUF5954 family protein n=1 Tax=Streptomyces tamarix TaxID=3078565 RepID=A0ABU3QMH4_9ACTN|nr:DUF5954 family protein [Streptomyces tamarix]MDT9683961.1 DUF5954 family protein [Streptomyces tamarix]